MTALRRAAVAAFAIAVAALAPPAFGAPGAPRFDPPLHRDAREASGALDVERVAFGQRELRMVLLVRTAGAWPTDGLGGERFVCLVLARRGRLCVVPRPEGGTLLSYTPVRGDPRVVPATVARRNARSLRASFPPAAVDLRLGRVRWALETSSERVPADGFFVTSRKVLGHPYCFAAAARDTVRPCRNPALRRVVFPRPADAFIWDNSPCRRLGYGRGVFDPCEFGVTAGGHTGTFLLIGDSHAMHWRPALQVVAEARRWRGISVARPGCPFSVRIPRTPALGPGACARLHRRAVAWLRAHPEVETVFVSSWAPPGSSPIGGNAAYGGGAADYGAMIDRLPPSVKRVYVLRDIPGTRLRTIACVRSRRRRGLPLARACAIPRSSALVPDPAAATAASRPRARALDFSHLFCDTSRCYPVIGGAYVHKDLDHMNAVFSMSLGPFVLRALEGR